MRFLTLLLLGVALLCHSSGGYAQSSVTVPQGNSGGNLGLVPSSDSSAQTTSSGSSSFLGGISQGISQITSGVESAASSVGSSVSKMISGGGASSQTAGQSAATTSASGANDQLSQMQAAVNANPDQYPNGYAQLLGQLGATASASASAQQQSANTAQQASAMASATGTAQQASLLSNTASLPVQDQAGTITAANNSILSITGTGGMLEQLLASAAGIITFDHSLDNVYPAGYAALQSQLVGVTASAASAYVANMPNPAPIKEVPAQNLFGTSLLRTTVHTPYTWGANDVLTIQNMLGYTATQVQSNCQLRLDSMFSTTGGKVGPVAMNTLAGTTQNILYYGALPSTVTFMPKAVCIPPASALPATGMPIMQTASGNDIVQLNNTVNCPLNISVTNANVFWYTGAMVGGGAQQSLSNTYSANGSTYSSNGLSNMYTFNGSAGSLNGIPTFTCGNGSPTYYVDATGMYNGNPAFVVNDVTYYFNAGQIYDAKTNQIASQFTCTNYYNDDTLTNYNPTFSTYDYAKYDFPYVSLDIAYAGDGRSSCAFQNQHYVGTHVNTINGDEAPPPWADFFYIGSKPSATSQANFNGKTYTYTSPATAGCFARPSSTGSPTACP